MKLRRLFVLGSLLLFGTATFAQDYARVEVPLNYSYVRFNPENSNITHGLSLNGGGGAVVVYFNHFFLGSRGSSRAMLPPAPGPLLFLRRRAALARPGAQSMPAAICLLTT